MKLVRSCVRNPGLGGLDPRVLQSWVVRVVGESGVSERVRGSGVWDFFFFYWGVRKRFSEGVVRVSCILDNLFALFPSSVHFVCPELRPYSV